MGANIENSKNKKSIKVDTNESEIYEKKRRVN